MIPVPFTIIPGVDDATTFAVTGLGFFIASYVAMFIVFGKEAKGMPLLIPAFGVLVVLGILGWWPAWAILTILVFAVLALTDPFHMRRGAGE